MNIKKVYDSTIYMILEFLFFYVFVPFIAIHFLDGWLKIIPLLLIALFFFLILRIDPEFDIRTLYRVDRQRLKKSLPRMIIISILIVWFTFWIYPELFLKFLLEDFENYLITLLFYPVLSVIPQELVYRVYFFHRYKKIIPEKYLLMLSNAIIFGLTHWIYANWVAPIATFLVSWIFIFTYLKSKSLLNVSFEHYIYGFIMFTVGFGYFFS